MPAEDRPTPVSRLSPFESYDVLREQLQHEDNLITQRLSWLMGSQAFLFTAYAIVLNSPERPKNFLVGSLQDYFLGTLPVVSLLCAALIYVSIIAGVLAMLNIYRSESDFYNVVAVSISAASRRQSHTLHGICLATPPAAHLHHRLVFAREPRFPMKPG